MMTASALALAIAARALSHLDAGANHDLVNVKAHHPGAALNLLKERLGERIGDIGHYADATRPR